MRIGRQNIRSQPVAVQHIEEIGIASGVELIGAFEFDSALAEEIGQCAVSNGGAELSFEVVAQNGKALLFESPGEVGIARNEDWNAVDECHAGVECALGA